MARMKRIMALTARMKVSFGRFGGVGSSLRERRPGLPVVMDWFALGVSSLIGEKVVCGRRPKGEYLTTLKKICHFYSMGFQGKSVEPGTLIREQQRRKVMLRLFGDGSPPFPIWVSDSQQEGLSVGV
jgi:hypothetical protein